VVNPDDSLRTAAELMANHDSEALPVGENDRLIGAITDTTSLSEPSQKAGIRRKPQYAKRCVLMCSTVSKMRMSPRSRKRWANGGPAPTRGEPGQTTRRDRVARRSRCWNR